MEKGIIVKGIGGFYYVETQNGIVECRARGKFRNECIKPSVGDYVEIDVGPENTGTVLQIMPRKNHFIRPPISNIDTLVLVASLKNPEPDFLFIDKISVIANMNNVNLVLCFNKADLTKETDSITEIYKNTGYEVVFTSALSGESTDELKKMLISKTGIVAFSGFSGVGKSSLLSNLTNLQLQTGIVSEKLKRGKHTTRHVELFKYNDLYFADTPGFSMLELPKIDKNDLEKYFPEFSKYLGDCKFTGCSHINERDCAVKKALENGFIDKSRYNSYKIFYDKLKSFKEW
ncbi:MAG: ribosome small subunit-dependent GTPase A [Ruminococcaceae bacterium]|nr:ribosome small subunit-dependent GTPase A [Oscillospiraceae bacterium]